MLIVIDIPEDIFSFLRENGTDGIVEESVVSGTPLSEVLEDVKEKIDRSFTMAKTQAERSRECQRRRREKAKETGMCIVCCKEKARPLMATCQECSDRINKRAKARRAMDINHKK